MIHLDTPQWFIDEHEGMADTWEEFICEADNPLWRNGAKEYMHALIDKCDELMGDRIFGYLLMAGGTTEWYTRFIDRAMDNPSENHIKSYKNWCGDENAKIPSFAEYTAVQHGIFLPKMKMFCATADTFPKKRKKRLTILSTRRKPTVPTSLSACFSDM
ncbi:MAG: hypothetical protein L6V93_06170 [Clostridiales bacterium]|nr:MAG: hypothetical protein L6V93_06170 [Clostridiales bacterium]